MLYINLYYTKLMKGIFLMKFKFRKKLCYIKTHLYNKIYKYNLIKNLKKGEKRFILVGSPLHGNLGDHAITLAEKKYLNDNFKNMKIIEIPSVYFKKFKPTIKKYIKKEDIICIQGGGFFGSLWTYDADVIYETVRAFATNHIIIMPQTIFYENTEFGYKQFEFSKELLNRHKNLCICTRENISYDLARKNYTNNIILVPDIVLYLYGKIPIASKDRQGVLLCFRNDKEKNLSDDSTKYIINKLRFEDGGLKYTDTVVEYNIYEKNRDIEIQKKLEEFASAKLVITDRLHGMIFSAITRTPCIVMENNNYKIKGVYDWIKDTSNIKLLSDIEEFDNIYNELNENKERLDLSEIHKEFAPLTKYIKSHIEVQK